MDGSIEIDQLALTKFGIGQPVPRNEGPMLVRGQGQYTDDLNLPGQAYAVIVRSGYAHGLINGIDTEEASRMPGVVDVVKYSMVNDFGVIANPLLVAGQAHGGVVQGIGQAPMERTVFDEEGQFLTGSFTDYALPRASDAVMFQVESHPVPAKTNPIGAKGCGEAGCAGSLPAVMNAVVDALSEYGIRHIDMPATPHRVWQAIQQKRKAKVSAPCGGQ